MEIESSDSHFALRLIAPRPTFHLDMTDAERAVMDRHGAYWTERMQAGRIVVYGPVITSDGSYGLGVMEADSEDEVLAFTAADPAVTSGLMHYEIGRMPVAIVRR